MNKTAIKKEITKFKTRIRRKVKFSPKAEKEQVLRFVFSSTDELSCRLAEEFKVVSFDLKERLNELVGLQAV